MVVSGPEWELLGTERRLSGDGWAARDRAYQAVLNLQPANLREARLRDQMLDRLTDIARFRQLRGEVAHTRSGGVFWIPAIAGLALVSIPFFVFAPTRANRLLISSFGAFSGLILFLIAAFSNPFSHPFRVAPGPFTKAVQPWLMVPVEAVVGNTEGLQLPGVSHYAPPGALLVNASVSASVR